MTYPKVQAQVDGKTVLAVAVGDATYLNWTVAHDSGCNLTKILPNDVEINGNKPPQVYDGTTTYILWSDIPSIEPNPTKDASGVWQFKTRHTYTWVITEEASKEVGLWASIKIQTLDNGQPLGHQLISIAENGVQQTTDFTDANGQYPWQLTETSSKTDTMTFTWRDPAEQVHTATHSTTFTVPHAEPTPVPSDDKVVAQFPILPSSDAADAVYFEMTAPDGTKIQCQLDTGAWKLMFTSAAAKILGLSHDKDITIGGVGGTTSAYDSTATFSIGSAKFTGVPCVVADSFKGYPLFGYTFFVDNNYDLLVSHIHHTVTILKQAS